LNKATYLGVSVRLRYLGIQIVFYSSFPNDLTRKSKPCCCDLLLVIKASYQVFLLQWTLSYHWLEKWWASVQIWYFFVHLLINFALLRRCFKNQPNFRSISKQSLSWMSSYLFLFVSSLCLIFLFSLTSYLYSYFSASSFLR
jgi:hypothetical protein